MDEQKIRLGHFTTFLRWASVKWMNFARRKI